MASITTKLLMCAALCIVQIHSEEDLRDFDFDSDPEIMIAQESRQYQTIVKAPFKPSKTPIKILKPNGITNSHRPQYNIDSEEEMKTHRSDSFMDLIETTTKKTFEKGYPGYQTSYKWRSKEGMIREAVLRALERKDHVGRFAQILPIIRSMSGAQRGALASLVAHQVTTPPGRAPLNLAQVRSMFGNHENTSSELMLPILLDMAKMIRRAVGPGKEPRSAPPLAPHNMIRRSSIDDDILLDNDPFETYEDTTTTKAPRTQQNINRSRARNRVRNAPAPQNRTAVKETKDNTVDSDTKKDDVDDDDTHKTTPQMSPSPSSSTTEPSTSPAVARSLDNGTLDLATDATNQTLVDLPTAEKLRAFNRYVDRKGNHIHRGNFPKPSPAPSRRSTPEPGSMGSSGPSGSAGSVGSAGSKPRRRPAPARKLPAQASDGKCELFTNSLCLHTEDYPTDLIIQSIRRNKAAAGALLADYRDPGDGAVDGVSAQQEAQYTPEHYLVSNRRGDTASRDFASAGEAGFMCPSTVKYARPQRARATSGQWKYIVNTGEHTQTLRLEKCLKPKDSCTYLTDNFKSKCVQVYNYHRLLTWDQQNGLHMDIFKVPTCCSCHIEGYSVNFPPLGHRVHETSSAESFPGEDLSAEHGNGAFESVQPSIKRPSIAKTPPFAVKPLETFPSIGENHNIIPGNSYPNMNLDDHDVHASNPMDSYGNSYFPDSFNQASNNVRNVKRPPSARHPAGATGADGKTLPSYLEPPTPAAPSSFSFMKEPTSKYKITNSNHFKRGAPRPNRRPIRKTISGAPDDLVSSGTSAVESHPANIESLEDFNDDLEEPDIITANNPPSPVTIAPKLPAVEPSSTTARPQEPTNNHNNRKPAKKDSMNNGKRVNYNYHPIIDFFEEDKESSSIDREDTMAEYMPAAQSEWKPIDHPVSRSKPNNNLVGRRKH